MKIYINLKNKHFEERFLYSVRKFESERIQIFEDIELRNDKDILLTDQAIDDPYSILLSSHRDENSVFIYQRVDKLVDDLLEKIGVVVESNKETKFITLLNINFSILDNFGMVSFYNKLSEDSKVLVVNVNNPNKIYSNSLSLYDIYFASDLNQKFELDKVLDDKQAYHKITSHISHTDKKYDIDKVIKSFFKSVSDSKYDYCFIEVNLSLKDFALSILKNSNKSILFYSNYFDQKYVEETLKYLKNDNKISENFKLVSIGTSKNLVKADISVDRLEKLPERTKIYEFIK